MVLFLPFVAAMDDLRRIVAAEAAYSTVNGGLFDEPSCLAEPRRCLPRYEGAPFLDRAVASLDDTPSLKRRFHAGPRPASRREGTSPSSLTSFACTAVSPAGRACADSTGTLCDMQVGAEPAGGRCPEMCEPLAADLVP